jgi:hypothetical protein
VDLADSMSSIGKILMGYLENIKITSHPAHCSLADYSFLLLFQDHIIILTLTFIIDI